jgi:hypothetical protein
MNESVNTSKLLADASSCELGWVALATVVLAANIVVASLAWFVVGSLMN